MLEAFIFEKDPLKPAGHAIHEASKMGFTLTAVITAVEKARAKNKNQAIDSTHAQNTCSISLSSPNANACRKPATLSPKAIPPMVNNSMIKMIVKLFVNNSLHVFVVKARTNPNKLNTARKGLAELVASSRCSFRVDDADLAILVDACTAGVEVGCAAKVVKGVWAPMYTVCL